MTTRIVTALAIWALLVIGVCASGTLERLPTGVYLLGVLYMIPIMATVALYMASPSARAWMLALDMRLLMAFHITRWGGFAMLVAAGHMTSPRWSVSGGIGDCLAASGMGAVALSGFMRGRVSKAQVIFWNVVGIADALHVATLAMLMIPWQLGFLAGDTPLTNASMALTFPFNLITVLFVPILFSASLIVLLQTRGKPAVIEFPR